MLGWLIGRVGIDNLLRTGRLPEALVLIERGLQTDPDDLRLRERRARVLDALGRTGDAVPAYLDAAERLESAGDGVRALHLLSRAAELRPDDAELAERVRSLSGLAHLAGLSETPVFAAMAREDLVALLLTLDSVVYGPGEILITEGEPGDAMLILGTGSVKIYKRDEYGRNRLVKDLEAPVVVGELALLDGAPRSATVTAAEEVDALVLPGDRLDALRAQHPALAAALDAVAARRRAP